MRWPRCARRRCPRSGSTPDELAYLCFGANDDLADEVFGDERGAAVMQMQTFGSQVAAWLILVAVHPVAQVTGAARSSCTRSSSAHARSARTTCSSRARSPATSGPASTSRTRGPGCCSRRCGFERDWLGTNMAIDTTFRRAPPPGVVVERETGAGAHDFAARRVPALGARARPGRRARHRVRRARRRRRHDRFRVSLREPRRAGSARWRPIRRSSTAASVRRSSARSAPTSRRAACATGEISWVSNLRFYGKCGARVSRVFLGGKLAL